ncbi:MAG TPA: prepilin-type N-terminal cleavage/methylation domain-containing protein [Patescibacteria group bacterium]|jgi:Tfp pilus assembly protein PilV|nr:prepilin-type N-terminal cleavage/methylation domain-containing protein [Patescibacteria group bacterium]
MYNYRFSIKKPQQGISLIEVIVSMFVVAAIFILYISALNTVATTRKLKYEDLAYHVANKKMEELRATSFASLPASGSISDSMLNQIPSGVGSFTVANYSGYAGLKEITVTVTWTDPVAKQVQLKTVAGAGGINPP